jgi:hypothetical protein
MLRRNNSEPFRGHCTGMSSRHALVTVAWLFGIEYWGAFYLIIQKLLA